MLSGGASMNVWLFILLMCVLLIAVILILFWHPQRSQAKKSTLTDRQSNNFIFRNDERYWYGGVFYNNPDDPALFVPKRYGLGWTMNFGHPQSKIVMIGIVLLAILPPVIVALIGTLYPGSIHPIGCHPSGCYPAP